ncbi:VanZ family protein [Oceanobacillus sp. FSL H7-0719]|uniref:VanZ family protein n=1 Tax=Oceanobacillus sp. FSL H7-0719 TaxID=2954507 RepID=UPI00324DB9C4
MKRNKYYAIILSQLVFLICLPIFLQLFSYLHPIVIFVLWMCVTVFVCFSVFLLWKQTIVIPRFILNVVFIIYACCLLILLFFRPGGQVYDSWNLVPFSTVSYFLSGEVHFLIAFYNLAANIGLFIPFGFVLMQRVKSKPMRFIIPFLSISIIELAQFLTQRGSLDIDDLILNMIGVYLGCLLTPLFLRVVIIRAKP